MAYITRLQRSSMLDVLGPDYVRTARAKGLAANKVIYKHALKNALSPVITYAGPMMAYILTGSMVVENIFSVPGLGRLFTQQHADHRLHDDYGRDHLSGGDDHPDEFPQRYPLQGHGSQIDLT